MSSQSNLLLPVCYRSADEVITRGQTSCDSPSTRPVPIHLRCHPSTCPSSLPGVCTEKGTATELCTSLLISQLKILVCSSVRRTILAKARESESEMSSNVRFSSVEYLHLHS